MAESDRRYNGYINLMKELGQNDYSEQQLHEWDQQGKMYVEGNQYISPQGIHILRKTLENQGSSLVTAAPSANAVVHNHYNHSIRNHQNQAEVYDEDDYRSLDTESLDNSEELKQQRQCTQDQYMSVVSPTQKVTEFPMKSPKTTSSRHIDKISLPIRDSGLADMDNWSPIEDTSDSKGNWSPEEPTSVSQIAVEADQSQHNNIVTQNNVPSRAEKVHISVVFNGPIYGTLNINGPTGDMS